MAEQLVDIETVSVQRDLGGTLEECVRGLAAQLDGTGRLTDVDAFVADVLAREEKGSTALPGGVALPHARSAAVAASTVAVASLPTPVTAPNGQEFDLVFLLAVPETESDHYLQLLRKVTTAAVKPGFRSDCRAAESPARLAVLTADALEGR
jgi:mannitol/fructose-specific phosphotransferase system IIA component (Ntr-type)